MKLDVNLQYFITRNGLREFCCKRSETHYTNAVAIVATNGSLPLRAVPRKLVPLTPDPHDSSSQMDKTNLSLRRMDTTWKWKAKNTSGNGHRESLRAESEQGGEGSGGHSRWATKLADQPRDPCVVLGIAVKKCFSSVRASGQKQYFDALSFELKLLKWFHNFLSLPARCQKWEKSWAEGQANKYLLATEQRPCQNWI